jgi:hypothetical protein
MAKETSPASDHDGQRSTVIQITLGWIKVWGCAPVPYRKTHAMGLECKKLKT